MVEVPLVVDWDGNLMENLMTKKHVVIYEVEVCPLFSVFKIRSETG